MAFKAIPVVAAKVSGTHSNFPVYLKPSAISGWGSLTSAEAASLRFYSDEAKTTELAREIVGAGDEIHVKVPSLTTTTTIYADYDGVRADYAVTDTYGRNAVWSDYAVVMHFNDATNSTGGTAPSATSMSYVTGKIGDAGDGAGAGYVTIADSAALTFTNGYTHQAWVYYNATPSALYRMIHKENASPSEYSMYGFSGSTVGLEHVTNAATGGPTTTTHAGFNTTWKMVHFRYNKTTQQTFVDGSSERSSNYTANLNNNAGALSLFGTSAGGARWNGRMDEYRVRAGGTSNDWITTEYNNQSDVAAFWGTVTDAGGGANPTGFFAFF